MRVKIKNKILEFLKQKISEQTSTPTIPNFQMNDIEQLIINHFRNDRPQWKLVSSISIGREIIQQLINNGILYIGKPNEMRSGFPWFTITNFGIKCLNEETVFPYDPEGYITAIKQTIPNIDDVTLAYLNEAVATYNNGNLLSSTITLGTASENLILVLIDSFINWLQKNNKNTNLIIRIKNKGIYLKFEELKKEIKVHKRDIPSDLKQEIDTYLDTIFNFIRVNRNSAGHPTGKKLNSNAIYANLQIFGEYSVSIYKLMDFFSK